MRKYTVTRCLMRFTLLPIPLSSPTFLLALCLLPGCGTFLSSDTSKWEQADFDTRCHAPGVVRCFGFDSPQEIAPYIQPVPGTLLQPEVDPAEKASGAGSLRFTIPSRSGANTSGLFMFNFADDYSVQFGEGDEFYIQWRQRFSPELLQTVFEGGMGWKQLVVGEGDRPGYTTPGCTQLELVVSNTNQFGAAQMYHSCGGKDGQFEPLFQRRVVSYQAGHWMTFQLHVKIGRWYKNDYRYAGDSTVQLWVAEEGRPSILVIDLNPEAAQLFGFPIPGTGTGYDLANSNPEAKYGKVLLTPYHTGKNEIQDHPVAYIWYDDVIVSRSRIAEPR